MRRRVRPFLWPCVIASIFLAAADHPWWVFALMMVGYGVEVTFETGPK